MLELIHSAALSTAEQLANQILSRDPLSLKKLGELSGKVIALELEPFALQLFILPHNEGLQLHSSFEGEPDCLLKGNVTEFITLLGSQDKADVMFGNTIQVNGNLQLCRKFQAILAEHSSDWEQFAADFIGDLPAHQLTALINWKADQSKQTLDSLSYNIKDYLIEELRILPSAAESKLFYNQVEQLQQRADRIAARMQQLSKHQD